MAFIEQTLGGPQPPMDVEADAIIRASFVRNPDAAYRMTMRAMALSEGSAPPDKLPRKGWLFDLLDRSGLANGRGAADVS